MPHTIPILLDTDIGTNIDDALALAFLLSEPRCELAGITTVGGDVGQRAALAQALCDAAGRGDVPVHCGDVARRLESDASPGVLQYEALRDLPHRRDWQAGSAVDFMRGVIHDRPGEVTLLSIGPLTNVAGLFTRDSEAPRLLKGWVSMAGNFVPDAPPETNARADSSSTALAFQAPVPHRLHLGYNVTSRCRLSVDDVRRRLDATPLLRLVRRLAEPYFATHTHVGFHDPLAAYVLFDPSVIATKRGRVSVDAATGLTTFEANASGRDEIAVDVRADIFLDRFFATIAG